MDYFPQKKSLGNTDIESMIVEFCSIPRSRAELCALLKISSVSYMMEKYINPLLSNNMLKMTIPDKPKSRNQRYYSQLHVRR
jgi:ATP-dependent DNA helicase RecG